MKTFAVGQFILVNITFRSTFGACGTVLFIKYLLLAKLCFKVCFKVLLVIHITQFLAHMET